jgi:hypothetical protein
VPVNVLSFVTVTARGADDFVRKSLWRSYRSTAPLDALTAANFDLLLEVKNISSRIYVLTLISARYCVAVEKVVSGPSPVVSVDF